MNALSFIEKCFGWIWQTTWHAAVLVIFILVAQWFLRNRTSPVWRNAVWGLLVLRLLMPASPASELSVFNLANYFTQPVISVRSVATSPNPPLAHPKYETAPAAIEDATASAPSSTPPLTANPPLAASQPAPLLAIKHSDWRGVATGIWLFGAMVFAIRFLWLNYKFGRSLTRTTNLPNEMLAQLFRQCAASMSVSTPVVLIETSQVESPAVFGVWRKRLLLPIGLREELLPDELRHVIRHELAHIKLRDLELNCVVSVLQILHWFNPVLWLAFARMKADREMAADQFALAGTKFPERQSYGNSIVKVLEKLANPRSSPGLIGIAESRRQIKTRIQAIARGDLTKRGRWAGAWTAAALSAFVLTGASETNSPLADQPQVLSVSPPNGATGVAPLQEIKIRFDRPMDPNHLRLAWKAGGFQPDGSVQVSDDQKEFTIPVRLLPGHKQSVVINQEGAWNPKRAPGAKPPRSIGANFRDANGIAATTFQWSFYTQPLETQPGGVKPKVISVSPVSGSTSPVLTFLQLTFDQPMQPAGYSLPFLQNHAIMEGAALIPAIDYDASLHRFLLPVRLPPDDDARLNLKGFYSASGAPCDTIVLHYQTSKNLMDANYLKNSPGSRDAKMMELLTSMKEARDKLTSAIETVHTTRLFLNKDSYRSFESDTAIFKFQGTNQVYADITSPMTMSQAFILGCDGRDCWIYSEDEKGEKRLDRTPANVTQTSFRIIDSFAGHSLKEILDKKPHVLEPPASVDGHLCYRISTWAVSAGEMPGAEKSEIWIDQQTFLPRQYVVFAEYGCDVIHFDISHVNEQLPDSAFEPPAMARNENHPLFFKEAPAADEHRFLEISDGGDGRMIGQIGWRDARGSTDSGMN